MIDTDFEREIREHNPRTTARPCETVEKGKQMPIGPYLGDSAKDVVTGFAGVITGKAEYISGCSQALIVPPVAADGAYREGQWFDIQRIEITAVKKVQLDNTRTPGADKEAPKR